MVKKIAKAVLLYIIFFIVEMGIYSFILFWYRNNVNIHYWNFVFDRLCGNNNINTGVIPSVIIILQQITEVSAIALLTSYIVSYISHRDLKLILPEKLVIRHRTSEGSDKKISLGILVGNRYKFSIYHVECAITFTYIKKLTPRLVNSEVTLYQNQIWLHNFYRFSFDLEDFPISILKDIIEKPEYYKEESITLTISGSGNDIGEFKVSKSYDLSQIIYDEHIPKIICNKKNLITAKDIIDKKTKKPKTYIDWTEITRVEEVNEELRRKSVNEILTIIQNKLK